MRERALENLQRAYQDTWSEDEIKAILAKGQRMLMWSDNDIAADFTNLRDENGNQAYHPELLRCAMKCYRRYQRQLWDPICEGNLPERGCPVEEWQFRRFGALGVFMIDMRGGRITSQGQVLGDCPIMSERQRAAFADALGSPGLMGLIVASEIPFITDAPADIRRKVETDGLLYLKDHWTYNVSELAWLLEAVFDWRAAVQGREVLLLGGDIHAGAESAIHDKITGTAIRQVTTSPVTGQPMPFLPASQG